MVRKIRKISAEKINRDRKKFSLTFSKKAAIKRAGKRTIFRAPSGVFAIKRRKK